MGLKHRQDQKLRASNVFEAAKLRGVSEKETGFSFRAAKTRGRKNILS